jgi:homoserine trans-succinylase
LGYRLKLNRDLSAKEIITDEKILVMQRKKAINDNKRSGRKQTEQRISKCKKKIKTIEN